MPTRARDWDRPVHKMMSDELTMDDLLQNGIKEGRDESAGGTAQGLTKTRKVGSVCENYAVHYLGFPSFSQWTGIWIVLQYRSGLNGGIKRDVPSSL